MSADGVKSDDGEQWRIGLRRGQTFVGSGNGVSANIVTVTGSVRCGAMPRFIVGLSQASAGSAQRRLAAKWTRLLGCNAFANNTAW
jgi:hypothetical protein